MKLLGKALLARKKSHDGSDVVMICGTFKVNSDDDLSALLGDKFNIGILDITINKGAVMPTDKQISPEDFLMTMDEFNWRHVIETGHQILDVIV